MARNEYVSPKMIISRFGDYYYNIEKGVPIISVELIHYLESIYESHVVHPTYELGYDMCTKPQCYDEREPIRIQSLLLPHVACMVNKNSQQALTPVVAGRMFRPSDFRLPLPSSIRFLPKRPVKWAVRSDGLTARSKIYPRMVYILDGTPLEDVCGDFQLTFTQQGITFDEIRSFRPPVVATRSIPPTS